jgi:hypothetical protein
MAPNAMSSVDTLPPFVKTKEIIGERLTIVAADYWQSTVAGYGDSAKYTLVRADGSAVAYTLPWTAWRERTVAEVNDRLEDGEDGVEVTLTQKPGKDGKAGALIWTPLETQRESQWLRDHRAERKGRLSRLAAQLPHVPDSVPNSVYTEDPGYGPDED